MFLGTTVTAAQVQQCRCKARDQPEMLLDYGTAEDLGLGGGKCGKRPDGRRNIKGMGACDIVHE